IRHIILLVLTGISIQVVLAFALDIILPLIPGAQEYYQITTNILFDKNCFSIVYVSILAPIAEEMIFRGLTFRFAGKAVNAWIANIIQAVLFAVYHMNVVQGVYTFLMGIVLGYVVMKMKSIWAAVILHSTINICGLLLDVIIPDASALTMLEKGLIEGVSLILVALLIREIPTIKERGYAI
ncbi:MAG: CPBP family intramembrane metalloprotease, partial [Clostridia bacterium]|nr:CPBP family intramembrane metalloprotease [Clostridia bacterium]